MTPDLLQESINGWYLYDNLSKEVGVILYERYLSQERKSKKVVYDPNKNIKALLKALNE